MDQEISRGKAAKILRALSECLFLGDEKDMAKMAKRIGKSNVDAALRRAARRLDWNGR